mmetsp:Transcript_6221/g.15108  ORF Transcript_6221/g.15108 Transcript_6221/m.15108 type:complete len:230 (+) Transcript_6221:223-912(+)
MLSPTVRTPRTPKGSGYGARSSRVEWHRTARRLSRGGARGGACFCWAAPGGSGQLSHRTSSGRDRTHPHPPSASCSLAAPPPGGMQRCRRWYRTPAGTTRWRKATRSSSWSWTTRMPGRCGARCGAGASRRWCTRQGPSTWGWGCSPRASRRACPRTVTWLTRWSTLRRRSLSRRRPKLPARSHWWPPARSRASQTSSRSRPAPRSPQGQPYATSPSATSLQGWVDRGT